MDILHKVFLGFSVALEPNNLLFCFIGTLVGTLVGVLPGLGPVGALSLLLPITFKMTPVTAIILLAGIYYGAMYGGSTTSILLNIPGESSSVITCLDGYQMARHGRAGPALGIAAFGSFIAGSVGVVGLMYFAPILGTAALSFGPPEFFAVTLLGLSLVTYLSKGSKGKAIVMTLMGLFAGTIGIDPITGQQRFTFGSVTLMDGLGIVPVAVGLFGITEVLENIGSTIGKDVYETKIEGLFPNRKDWKDSFWPITRGSIIGFFIGIFPGPASTIASFTSYAIEKKLSSYPERFGSGTIEGVAGPESANNSATAGAFIPLLSLGIPQNATMALFLGVLMIHGLQPGPSFINDYPEFFWGLITSMYIGNAMLLVLNLPLIGIWVKVLKIPYAILFPLILLFCLIGVYSLNNNLTEIVIMLVFGVLGFLARKIGFEGAPFLLAMVLEPIMERSLRQSLLISHGVLGIFFTRPISGFLMMISIAFVTISLLSSLKKIKKGIAY